MEVSIFWSLAHPDIKVVMTTDSKQANLSALNFILLNRSDEFFRFIRWNRHFQRWFILNRFECIPID